MLFHEECSGCNTLSFDGQLCVYCQHLRLYHVLVCTTGQQKRRMYYTIRTGTVKELSHRSQQCDYCYFVLRSIELKGIAWHGLWRVEDHGDEEILFSPGGENQEVVISLGEFSVPLAYNFKGDKRNISLQEVEERISSSRLKEWLSRCEEQHHPTQAKPGEHALPEGMLVIDVRKSCVVPAPENCKYVALSYVWGPPKLGQVEATKASINNLKQPGGLSGDHMPATIRDAMDLCRELDIQFLWVDRVCIIQDDGEFKMTQINSMDSIYSRAVVTLCAAAGNDSEAGLFGTKNTARTLRQRKFSMADLDIIAPLPSPRMFRNETWWTRGWTYQEYMLSERVILFSPWQAVFECVHGAFHEGKTSEAPPDWNRADKLAPLQSYQRTVGEYNNRTLSYASDIYNAFLGVYKSHYKDLEDYIFGHPAQDFDASLLWTRGPGIERAINDDSGVFPTWSWASATGWVRFHSECHGALAKWYRLPQNGDDLAPIHASGSDGAHPNWNIEDPSGPRPRLAIAVCWTLGLMEAPPLAAISKTGTLSELEEVIKRLWPTYQSFWESLRPPRIPADTHLEVQNKRGRIAFRSTVARLKLRNVRSALSGKYFDLVGKDGYMIGNGSTDTHESFDERTFLFVALSVDADGSNLARIVLENDHVIGKPICDQGVQKDAREPYSDKYGKAEL